MDWHLVLKADPKRTFEQHPQPITTVDGVKGWLFASYGKRIFFLSSGNTEAIEVTHEFHILHWQQENS